MKRFIEGQDRSQSTLFPESLEDYIAEDNPVRVIEVSTHFRFVRVFGQCLGVAKVDDVTALAQSFEQRFAGYRNTGLGAVCCCGASKKMQ